MTGNILKLATRLVPCGFILVASCNPISNSKPPLMPNLTVATYLHENPGICENISSKEIVTGDLEGSTLHYLNLGICQHAVGRLMDAKASLSKVIYLSEIFDVNSEAERIVYSYYRESENELESAWASDRLLKGDYSIYGQGGYSKKLSRVKARNKLNRFTEKFPEFSIEEPE